MLSLTDIIMLQHGHEEEYKIITPSESLIILGKKLDELRSEKILLHKSSLETAKKESEDFMKSHFNIHKILYQTPTALQDFISSRKNLSVEEKENLELEFNEYVENVTGNVAFREKTVLPEYELKLVERTKEDDKNDILIAVQKELEITYKYYELAFKDKSIEQVDTIENANQIINDIEEVTDKEICLTVNEKTTTNIEELDIKTLEVAKTNIIETLDIDTTEEIAKVNGIKIVTLPILPTERL